MINRNRKIETLFQRMGTRSGKHDPAVDREATQAVEQWPLLAMLTPGVRAQVERVPTVDTPAPPIQPAVVPTKAPVAPVVAPAALAPAATKAQLSPLDQLFSRSADTAKSGGDQSIFAPPPLKSAADKAPINAASAFAPPRKSTAETAPAGKAPVAAPPPLRTPAEPQPTRSVAPAPAPSAQADEGPLMVEPKPRQWRPLETVPSHLFDRAGAR